MGCHVRVTKRAQQCGARGMKRGDMLMAHVQSCPHKILLPKSRLFEEVRDGTAWRPEDVDVSDPMVF